VKAGGEKRGKTGSAKPVVVDLFCGCGGFSLGATRAGFSVLGAVDNDARSIRCHERNFPNTTHLNLDLSTVDGASLLRRLGIDGAEIDGVIGGPPCQGFSNIGRRESNDSRNLLLPHFFRLVSQIRPRFFLCENVPGLLNAQHENLRTAALNNVGGEYNVLPAMALSANLFGAPTVRTRVFLMGFRKCSGFDIDETAFAPPSGVDKVLVKDALKGLPRKIRADWQSEEQGWRKLGISANGAFGRRLSGMIPQGVGDPNAIRRLRKEKRVSGCLGTRHTPEVIRRFRLVPPGEIDHVSRFPRLDPNDFCPTLRAGTGSDKGSHQAARPIHPTEDRVITPREAARLQGFPDWFQFDPTKWHSFRQIGNSVSPILAERMLLIIRKVLRGQAPHDTGKRE